MRVALAQINPTLGAFADNRVKILEFARRAREAGCDLVVFPEASLFGYHPVDLLERHEAVSASEQELRTLSRHSPKDIALLVGSIVTNPSAAGKPYLNAAVLIQKGKRPRVFAKELLPTYDVFDEGRHIEPGNVAQNVFTLKGRRVLVTVCEDIWGWSKNARGRRIYANNPLRRFRRGSVDLVVNLSASPFTQTKLKSREDMTRQTARHFGTPVVYVNMVGAQDELIFDGGSFVQSASGRILARAERFAEELLAFDLETMTGPLRPQERNVTRLRRRALVLGIADFCRKIGIARVHMGLSGGIDSAVVACLAAEALGPENVTGVALPGPYNAPESLELARRLAENLGIGFHVVSIQKPYESVIRALGEGYGEFEFGLTHENVQARLRGLSLMALSNLRRSLLLNTSNKSEFTMGYTTLYGDLCGGLCPLGDLLKHEVYALARLYNTETEVIPERILSRAPSAELRPNQKDEDTLPPYERLDPAVERLVEKMKPPRNDLDRRVLKALMTSEFKRWQAPPILKVSDHAFGRGRRFPVAHRAF